MVRKGALIGRDRSVRCQHYPTEPVTRPYAHCIHTDTKNARSRFVACHPHSGWCLPPNPFFALLPSSGPSASFVIVCQQRHWKGCGSGDSDICCTRTFANVVEDASIPVPTTFPSGADLALHIMRSASSNPISSVFSWICPRSASRRSY